MARALAHSPRHTAHLQSRHYLPSQAQYRQGAQGSNASSVVLRTVAPCFDSVHLICWHLTIFTLLQIEDPHRTKRGNNAPQLTTIRFHYVCPHSLRNAWGLFLSSFKSSLFCSVCVPSSLSSFFFLLPLPSKQQQRKRNKEYHTSSFLFHSFPIMFRNLQNVAQLPRNEIPSIF